MGRIFLGKRIHWASIAALIAIGWTLGLERLHVTWFNLFTAILLLLSAALLALVLKTSKPRDRITREPLELDRH